ncbi:pyridoxal-phosphate dependent enzyme [Thermococcus sp. JdF3]|uniref:pyridoxal-phosphate dependent enzyme n=1 Tax=Thermococcus sp. JdF3 TaxID=1638258 RepID=UPI00143AE5C0|nr:pyridoxal-phosphate dependent enzyme [Thermococcus sp. JdF3]NJE01460.1 pyridoxal-phosphate dependent enzyme [Thermococcus sp. JdF3]
MEAFKAAPPGEYKKKTGSLAGESEAGDAPGGLGRLFRAPLLEEFLGINEIHIEYEGINPTGTHKDRIAMAHAKRAREEGFSGITVGTCGNYGVAIASYARLFGLRAYIFVPEGYTLERLPEMRALGAEVIMVSGTYEDAVEASRRFAVEMNVYDANPGSKRDVDFTAYSLLAEQILERVQPDAVFVPLGNGTTLAGLGEGFKERGARPRMIGVTTAFGNEVLRRFHGDSNEDFAETALNEPLVSGRSFDRDAALLAVMNSNGYVFGFADDTALRCSEVLHLTTGLKIMPASALTLAGLVKFVVKFGIRKGKFVLLLTGGVDSGRGTRPYRGALSDLRWENGPRARALFQDV